MSHFERLVHQLADVRALAAARRKNNNIRRCGLVRAHPLSRFNPLELTVVVGNEVARVLVSLP